MLDCVIGLGNSREEVSSRLTKGLFELAETGVYSTCEIKKSEGVVSRGGVGGNRDEMLLSVMYFSLLGG